MPQTDSPLVHVVILNWNGWRDTVECVASVKQTNYPNFQIVVVDNASSDDSEDKIRAAHPDITMLQSGVNRGYAGGNNVGIRHALDSGAPFVWILNNDTTVAPNTLAELVRATSDPGVGIVGSKIYYMGEPTRLWFAGGKIDWRRGIAYNVGADQDDRGQFDDATEAEMASGSSMLISRRTFERAGLFDERLFLYFEEADLCCRACKAGLRITFAPASRVWHNVSHTTGIRSPLWLYYFTRNNIQFVRRYRSPIGFLVAMPYVLKRSIKNLPSQQGTVSPRRLRIWLAAWFDGLIGRLGPRQGLAMS
jgi:GT2 family glycosyltransferase